MTVRSLAALVAFGVLGIQVLLPGPATVACHGAERTAPAKPAREPGRRATPPAAARETAAPAGARVVSGSEQGVAVVFVVRIVHAGKTALKSPQITMRLPVDLPHQSIARLEIEGAPQRLTDRWNAPLLSYQRKELLPGEALTGRWTASARVRQMRWSLGDPANSKGAGLSPEERALYLRDAKGFTLADPTIQAMAREVCAGREGNAARLEAIFDRVMDRLQYERDGRWQPAPEVLASGKGSCSEYSYAFIALCRASGVPARYVGGITGRAGAPFYLDTVFHRFPQAYVEGVGWVDFDPTRSDRPNNRRLFFGRTPMHMLLTCVGDGGEGSPTGWDYLESHRWEGKSPQTGAMRMGWWFPAPPPGVAKAVAAFRQRLGKAAPGHRNALVAQALAIDHPLVLPWLDDLLYDPASRVEAATACLKIGGDGALRAIVNSLRRLDDADGDRRVGELLDSFTGQKLGDDRAKWQQWLRTRPPPATTAAPLPEKKR